MKLDILRKEHFIRERLIRSQKSHVLCRQIRNRETGSIISMFEHNTNTIGSLRQIVQQSLLQEPQPIFARCFSRLEHDDRSPGFIVLRIKPVAEVKAPMDVWFVEGVVVEVVDGDGQVVGGVEE
jgi:hypothetical protein